jgi:hypothetical protein
MGKNHVHVNNMKIIEQEHISIECDENGNDEVTADSIEYITIY